MQTIIIAPKKPNICHTNPNINFFIICSPSNSDLALRLSKTKPRNSPYDLRGGFCRSVLSLLQKRNAGLWSLAYMGAKVRRLNGAAVWPSALPITPDLLAKSQRYFRVSGGLFWIGKPRLLNPKIAARPALGGDGALVRGNEVLFVGAGRMGESLGYVPAQRARWAPPRPAKGALPLWKPYQGT